MGGQTKVVSAALMLACVVAAAGCAKDGNQGETGGTSHSEAVERKPVTLTLYSGHSTDFAQTGTVEAVQKKFPWVTLNFMKGVKYSDWIAAQTPVDLIYQSTADTVGFIMGYGLAVDLEPYMKKHGFRTDAFEPNVLAHAKSTNSEGKLYGLPFTLNRYALFYNKDLFDRFGTAYPRDGMSWDEVYELAKRMTRTDAGVNYYGFTATPANLLLNNQLSLNALSLDADRAEINTEQWKLLFENVRRFGQIPENGNFVNANEILKGTVAMSLDPINMTKGELQWDLVSVPELPQKPKTGFKPASLSLFLSSTSKHPDEAFEVMAFLVSSEYQKELTRQAFGTPLIDPEVRKQFGQDLPIWQGKNVMALYYYPDAPALPPRKAGLVNVPVSYGKLFTMEGDANTILRTYNEELQLSIEAEKAKNAAK